MYYGSNKFILQHGSSFGVGLEVIRNDTPVRVGVLELYALAISLSLSLSVCGTVRVGLEWSNVLIGCFLEVSILGHMFQVWLT